MKYPLENRIWFSLPGQTNGTISGTYNMASAVGRVLDDGSTLLWLSSYDTTGFFNLTQSVDPLGRTTNSSTPTRSTSAVWLLALVTVERLCEPSATYTYDAFARVRTKGRQVGQGALNRGGLAVYNLSGSDVL